MTFREFLTDGGLSGTGVALRCALFLSIVVPVVGGLFGFVHAYTKHGYLQIDDKVVIIHTWDAEVDRFQSGMTDEEILQQPGVHMVTRIIDDPASPSGFRRTSVIGGNQWHGRIVEANNEVISEKLFATYTRLGYEIGFSGVKLLG